MFIYYVFASTSTYCQKRNIVKHAMNSIQKLHIYHLCTDSTKSEMMFPIKYSTWQISTHLFCDYKPSLQDTLIQIQYTNLLRPHSYEGKLVRESSRFQKLGCARQMCCCILFFLADVVRILGGILRSRPFCEFPVSGEYKRVSSRCMLRRCMEEKRCD